MPLKTKAKIVKRSLIICFCLTILTLFTMRVAEWFDENRLIFQTPIKISLYPPVQAVKREMIAPTIIEVAKELPETTNLTPIEKYICDKWGALDCKVALAVARAESKLKADAFNVNSNGTIDVGIFQINSIHFKKEGCSLAEVVDPQKNVDCAYKIWQSSGWSAWSVFNNGSFKERL